MRDLNDFQIEIQTIYQRLSTFVDSGDWSRAKQEFAVLHSLLSQVDSRLAEKVFALPCVSSLQTGFCELRARCEYAEERYWSQRISQQRDAVSELCQYPEYPLYETIVEYEYGLLNRSGSRGIQNILFIGGGPLPMTAILLAQKFRVTSTCIDRVAEACQLAQRLSEALDLTRYLRYRCVDILSLTELDRYDAVFLAALVGPNHHSKSQVVRHLNKYMQVGQILVLRTAHGWKRLIYSQVDVADLTDFRCQVLQESPVGVIQTTIVAEKR